MVEQKNLSGRTSFGTKPLEWFVRASCSKKFHTRRSRHGCATANLSLVREKRGQGRPHQGRRSMVWRCGGACAPPRGKAWSEKHRTPSIWIRATHTPPRTKTRAPRTGTHLGQVLFVGVDPISMNTFCLILQTADFNFTHPSALAKSK